MSQNQNHNQSNLRKLYLAHTLRCKDLGIKPIIPIKFDLICASLSLTSQFYQSPLSKESISNASYL